MFTNIQKLVQEIENRTDIFNITKDFLNFKKGSGDSSFFCGIPDHEDKTPSFIAKKGYQTYNCSSKCGVGNIFQLVSKVKHINYIEAVKQVALYVGIPEKDIKLGDKVSEIETNSTYTLKPEHIEYLEKRGIEQNTIRKFGLKSSNEEKYKECIVFPQILNNNLVGHKFLSVKNKNFKFFTGNNTSCKLFPDNSFDENIEILIFTAGEWDCMFLTQEIEKEIQKGNIDKKIKVVTSSTGEKSIPENLIQDISKAKNLEAIKIFYDNDLTGKESSLKLADRLFSIGKRIDIFYFPDDKKKGYDVSDFFQEGYNLDQLFSLNRIQYSPEMSVRAEGNQYEIERSILNFLLINNEFINDSFLLEQSDILDYRFSMLLANLRFLYQKYKYCDFDLLRKKSQDVNIKEAVDELIGAEPLGSFEEFKEYIEILKEYSTVRNIQKMSNQLNLVTKARMNRPEMVNEISKIYKDLIIKSSLDEKGKSLNIILNEHLESHSDTETLRFISTHLKSFNIALGGGIRVGKMSVLGAKPSVGKTTFAIDLCDHVVGNKIPLVYYASETDKEELSEMILSKRSMLNNWYFRTRQYPKEIDYEELIPKQYKDTDEYFHFVESHNMSIREVINDIRAKKRKYGIKFAVIDLLQAFKSEKGYTNRAEFMADVAIDLVSLPKEEEIGLLVLSHLKVPESPTSTPKLPILDDLAQTSELGRRGYLTFFLHTEDTAKPEMKLVIRKNRGGAKDNILDIKFLRHISKFVDFEEN